MKNLKLLLLPAGGFALFIIGTIIPLYHTLGHYAFIISGALLVVIFYFITLFHVINTFRGNSSKKVFWLIAIICIPVVGNVIYVVFSRMANRKQKPEGIW